MSIWGDNPEWFDEWAEKWLLGQGVTEEDMDVFPWQQIERDYPKQYPDLCAEAELAFCERHIT